MKGIWKEKHKVAKWLIITAVVNYLLRFKMKLFWLGISIFYIILGWASMDKYSSYYHLDLLDSFFAFAGIAIFFVGVIVLWILFLITVPKFVLNLLHDYIIKTIKENKDPNVKSR